MSFVYESDVGVGAESLPDSQLYTFIDEPRQYAMYFLEGQRLIRDLALLHTVRAAGFAYFRDAVLSIQPMIAFLKRGEQLGFYIDSEEPYFRLKIETGHHGDMRCVLFPDDFREFLETMNGIVRVRKLFPHNRPPYDSVIKAEALALRAIVNRVLQDSFQVNSVVRVSPVSDQSLMLHLLPPLSGKEDYEYSIEAARQRRSGIEQSLDRIFEQALHDDESIEHAFAGIGFRLLGKRRIRLRCGCSRQRMIENLKLVAEREEQSLFDPDQDVLELVCEYCKSKYYVSRDDMANTGNPVN